MLVVRWRPFPQKNVCQAGKAGTHTARLHADTPARARSGGGFSEKERGKAGAVFCRLRGTAGHRQYLTGWIAIPAETSPSQDQQQDGQYEPRPSFPPVPSLPASLPCA